MQIEGLNEQVAVRIGLHSGTVTAGVLGQKGGKSPKYTLVGDTVSTVCELEALGRPMMIHVSEAFYALTRDREDLTFQKGDGLQSTATGVIVGFNYLALQN